ncbi:hypothetical protein ACA910_019526 [Epithemia clementina (nom. ined.)]
MGLHPSRRPPRLRPWRQPLSRQQEPFVLCTVLVLAAMASLYAIQVSVGSDPAFMSASTTSRTLSWTQQEQKQQEQDNSIHSILFQAAHRPPSTTLTNTTTFQSPGWTGAATPKEHEEKEESNIVTNENAQQAVAVVVEQQQPQPILFVHFHKSGGSAVCRSMIQHSSFLLPQLTDPLGKPVQSFPRNCNAQGAGPSIDPRIAVQPEFQLTCDVLLPYTTNEQGMPFRRHNFVAMEVPMNRPYPCPQFRNFALMRHPIDRVQSHMKVQKWTEGKVRQTIQQVEEFILLHQQHQQRQRQQQQRSSHNRRQTQAVPQLQYGEKHKALVSRVYACINNMVIRQLLGYDRFLDYANPITEHDLDQAKAIVDQFHAFVPTEQQHHPVVLALLKQQIPEYHDALVRQEILHKLPITTTTTTPKNKNENTNNNETTTTANGRVVVEQPQPPDQTARAAKISSRRKEKNKKRRSTTLISAKAAAAQHRSLKSLVAAAAFSSLSLSSLSAPPYPTTTTTRTTTTITSESQYQPSAEFLQFLYQHNKYDLLLYEYIHEKLGLGPWHDEWKSSGGGGDP